VKQTHVQLDPLQLDCEHMHAEEWSILQEFSTQTRNATWTQLFQVFHSRCN